jgi:opacity protein-like surface antigen
MRFKKVIATGVVAVFLMISGVAHAQVLPKFGIKGGVNYSTFNNTDNVDYKPGFVGGIYSNINIPATPVSIQPEVLFAQYGADIEGSDASFNINYIQVPVLLKFGFGLASVKPNVFFGPYMGFNIKSEVKNNDASINLDDQAEDTDFGIAVGAGIDISKFSIGVRYTAGLKNVANSSIDSEAKNGAIALSLGVAF